MTAISACPACDAVPYAQSIAAKATPQLTEPNLFLSLPGIHCAACIGAVERALSATPGVENARVNLSLKRVAISATFVDTETLIEVLKQTGYEAYPLDAGMLQGQGDTVGRKLLIRLAVAGFAMMNVMLFSVAVWSGASDATRDLFHIISAMISLPAVLFCGQPFFSSAWSALRVRTMNMDVPISLAILLAAGMSLFEVLNSGAHAYFDAALSLTFFLLIGRYLDHHTRDAARSAAKELAALEVQTAQRVENGETQTVAVSTLTIGDTVMIPTGVRVPVDGHLISAHATTDRSFLTGESAAVNLVRNETVEAGEINLGAPFEMKATRVGEDTTLRRVAALTEMAENSRSTYTNLADKAARVYAPAVHLLAFAAFGIWVALTGDIRHALNIAVAVLIITCPCALGLAVPTVATRAIALLYAKGFLVKSGTALERIAEIDIAVFDKTGTLTLSGSARQLNHLSEPQIRIARALAQTSQHPVSRAILAALPAASPASITDAVEVAGCGVEGQYKGQTVRLGKGTWLGAEFDGTGLQIGTSDPVALPLSETQRPGVQTAIEGLRDLGIAPQILSGDRHDAVAELAQAVGIKELRAETSPTEKHTYLSALHAQGHHTLMIGDGLNDTAALAAAHASVAPASALDASRNAADVVIIREGIDELPSLIAIARSTVHLSKQNFTIAAVYNFIAVPFALLGYATPLLAAIAMSVSSITVLLNALRVGRGL
jgi:Cu2+-exporting ATPase